MCLRGWRRYFRLADTPKVFGRLDKWIRRRLRMLKLKQWKRGTTAWKALTAMGVTGGARSHAASRCRSWWYIAKSPAMSIAFSNSTLAALGLVTLAS